MHGQRRVPGLRREEVALLAGISAEYYLRLEQGRTGRPSVQVLHSLARALQLDEAATDYLLGLVALRSVMPAPTPTEPVPPSVLNLLDVIGLPAFVTNRRFDVLAANAVARAISPELTAGRNRMRSLFLVDAERALFGDWETMAPHYVAILRDVVGSGATDPSFVRLVEELTALSPRFRELWARHDVVAWDTQFATLTHPVVGRLRLHLERLDVPGGVGQSLYLFHPAAGSDDGARLAALQCPA